MAAAGGWVSSAQPGDWLPVERAFRDVQTERWWALEGVAGPYGPERSRRLVMATVDPATAPEPETWYLATTLPRADAALAEIVRLYGWRTWVEQQYKQGKTSLGWSQDQVRADRGIRRHWALVQWALACCWWVETYTLAPVARLAGTGLNAVALLAGVERPAATTAPPGPARLAARRQPASPS